ncbi:MAG: hypothetical protein AB7F66_01065 [Bacteriovoracia bacterium]
MQQIFSTPEACGRAFRAADGTYVRFNPRNPSNVYTTAVEEVRAGEQAVLKLGSVVGSHQSVVSMTLNSRIGLRPDTVQVPDPSGAPGINRLLKRHLALFSVKAAAGNSLGTQAWERHLPVALLTDPSQGGEVVSCADPNAFLGPQLINEVAIAKRKALALHKVGCDRRVDDADLDLARRYKPAYGTKVTGVMSDGSKTKYVIWPDGLHLIAPDGSIDPAPVPGANPGGSLPPGITTIPPDASSGDPDYRLYLLPSYHENHRPQWPLLHKNFGNQNHMGEEGRCGITPIDTPKGIAANSIFRAYFIPDKPGYAGMACNAANGWVLSSCTVTGGGAHVTDPTVGRDPASGDLYCVMPNWGTPHSGDDYFAAVTYSLHTICQRIRFAVTDSGDGVYVEPTTVDDGGAGTHSGTGISDAPGP